MNFRNPRRTEKLSCLTTSRMNSWLKVSHNFVFCQRAEMNLVHAGA